MPSTYSPARPLSAQRAPGRGARGERFSQRQPPGRAGGVGGSRTEPPPAGVPRLRRSQPGICLPAPPGGAGLPPPPRLPPTPPGCFHPAMPGVPPPPGFPSAARHREQPPGPSPAPRSPAAPPLRSPQPGGKRCPEAIEAAVGEAPGGSASVPGTGRERQGRGAEGCRGVLSAAEEGAGMCLAAQGVRWGAGRAFVGGGHPEQFWGARGTGTGRISRG